MQGMVARCVRRIWPFALAGLVVFLIAEVWLRLTQPVVSPESVRRQSLEYSPSLFARQVFPPTTQEKGKYRINARGYRGPLFAVPKPQDRFRILLLGGSAAFDTQAEEGEDWPRRMEQQLRHEGWSSVEVINAGVPAHATWDSLGRLYSEIWLFEPDVILVYHAWNDIKYFHWLGPEKSLLRGERPVPAAALRGEGASRVFNPHLYYYGLWDRWLSVSQVYVRLRWRWLRWRHGAGFREGFLGLAGAEETADSYPDAYPDWGLRQYRLNLSLIVDAARSFGAEPILMTQARRVAQEAGSQADPTVLYHYVRLSPRGLIDAFVACDQVVREVAAEKGVPVWDISAELSGRQELFEDHVHTTAEGSRALAEAVGERMLRWLEAREPPPVEGAGE